MYTFFQFHLCNYQSGVFSVAGSRKLIQISLTKKRTWASGLRRRSEGTTRPRRSCRVWAQRACTRTLRFLHQYPSLLVSHLRRGLFMETGREADPWEPHQNFSPILYFNKQSQGGWARPGSAHSCLWLGGKVCEMEETGQIIKTV